MPKYRLKIPNLTNIPQEVEAVSLIHNMVIHDRNMGVFHGEPDDYFIWYSGNQFIQRKAIFEKCYEMVEG